MPVTALQMPSRYQTTGLDTIGRIEGMLHESVSHRKAGQFWHKLPTSRVSSGRCAFLLFLHGCTIAQPGKTLRSGCMADK